MNRTMRLRLIAAVLFAVCIGVAVAAENVKAATCTDGSWSTSWTASNAFTCDGVDTLSDGFTVNSGGWMNREVYTYCESGVSVSECPGHTIIGLGATSGSSVVCQAISYYGATASAGCPSTAVKHKVSMEF